MSKTKISKILITVLCFAMVVTISATVFGGSVFNQVKPNTSANGTNNIIDIGNNIAGIIQVVGIILSVICLMVLGIKYMMGSAEEKAEYKKTFIPYLVGAVILFAASVFAKTIYSWVSGSIGG